MYIKSLTLAAVISTAAAQNATVSFCDKYTTALFKNNTAENQLKLLTAVVNTAVIGNFSATVTGTPVAGILAKGTYDGHEVDLLPYFNGALLSSNRGGSKGVSINFLDDGGATPLTLGKPSNGTSSNQYLLLTHLYEFFGSLLQCSQQGNSAYPAYSGEASMFEVHKFMNLDVNEVGYFITQVAGAAASFGVSTEDLAPVGKALNSLFGVRCAPKTTVIPAQGAQLQSICDASDCPIAPGATCTAEYNTFDPAAAPAKNGTATSSGSASSPTASGSASSPSGSSTPSTVATSGATAVGMSLMAVFGGLAALCL